MTGAIGAPVPLRLQNREASTKQAGGTPEPDIVQRNVVDVSGKPPDVATTGVMQGQ